MNSLPYSKHVEDVIRIKLKKVYLVGFIILSIMMQVNIISKYLTLGHRFFFFFVIFRFPLQKSLRNQHIILMMMQ